MTKDKETKGMTRIEEAKKLSKNSSIDMAITISLPKKIKHGLIKALSKASGGRWRRRR